ncbi:hypothetical protein HPB50_021213 [Hyalomma asiaticum]|uniref:Uncharacterized protein n=1 Tax=Hyalomma asiaticum TaxID=266040 RepID=A0ACB7RVP6_HYAAI|nr:hypothetical protein HPB50_021213 [Hyalomma asiaticum]
MAKLQGLFLAKMSMIYLNITELPASWFTNHIVYKLRIMHCGLRDAAAVCRINGMRYIVFSDNEMESVPECLSRANRLRTLLAPRNRMKRLRGTLVFPELQRLDFTRNGIETIDEGYFSGLPNLRYLRLSHNNIHKLLPNLFRKTISLVELMLNDNSIRSVQEVFNHLHRLEALDLSKNEICDIEKLARSTLPYFRHLKELRLTENCITLIPRFLSRNGGIRRLNLKDNSVTHIIAGAFEQLEELTAIDLSRNIISNLSDSYFAHHSILEDINLSRNNLTTVSTLFDRTRKIKTINLSFNRIADISVTFRGLTELRAVFLKSNSISSVSDGTFQDNVRLVKIDLSFNNIAWIGMDAFKGLVNVNILNLERNRILSLNFSLSGLPKLEYIDASYNAILTLESGEFQNNRHLIKVTLKENNITNVQGAFIAATGLLYLDLAGNQVKLLRRSDFAEETTNVPAVNIDNNPFICDCRMAWLMEEDGDIEARGSPMCAEPRWLKGKPMRVLERQYFLRWEDDCEPGCQCECHEGALGEREISVNCSSATVGRIPRVLPESTTRLDLSGNQLLHLDETVKKAAPHLQVLSLKDNALTSISITSIPDRLTSLDLRGNKLKGLPFFLVTRLNLTSMWLSRNPYSCDCADYSFRQWFQANGKVVRDASDIVCARSPNLLVSGKQFLSLGQNDLCPVVIPRWVVHLLLAFGLLVVLLGLSATYLRYKDVIRTWLRVHGVCGWACWDEEDDMQKLFDVFVSFSSRDIDFIHDEILPELDAMGLSYCTYERNFKGGYLLQDIIRDAVACSRRTLLVLTQNFVASEWCRFEFRLAHQRALQDNVNRLLIVLMEELEPGMLDDDLRLHVRAANYLRWGEPNFWSRLQHSLAAKKARRKLIVKGEGTSPQLAAIATGEIELE